MFEREPLEKVRLYWWRAKEKAWGFDESPLEPITELSIMPGQIRCRFCLFDLPPKEQTHWCLVDSGAMLTLIPKHVWQSVHDRIRWLHTSDGTLTRTKVGGSSVLFRLGLVTMHFVDFEMRILTRQIIAGCVTKGNLPKTTVLGLGFGKAISDGGLTMNFLDESFWLVSW